MSKRLRRSREKVHALGRFQALAIAAALIVVFAAGCNTNGSESAGSDQSQSGAGSGSQRDLPQGAETVDLDPKNFSTRIDNPYWPMDPGTRWTYSETDQEGSKLEVVVTVSDQTKKIANGVTARVVRDTVTEDGAIVEDTFDWYAQDKEGNIWYLGENTAEFENGKLKTKEGSWEAGKHGAKPGIIMPANPKVGHTYRQEYRKGVAEDMARPVMLGGSASVPYGSFHHVLVTDEWTPLEKNVAEQKYYAGGVGTVLEEATKGPKERLELVNVKHG